MAYRPSLSDISEDNMVPESEDSGTASYYRPSLSDVKEMPTESLGTSLGLAIPRIGTDLAKGAYGFLQNIPGYLSSAKTEVPGLLSAQIQHPAHAALQALAGSQELINNLAQMPKNLATYANERLHLLPEGAVNAISKITPEDTTQSINALFGKPEYEGEDLIRGVARNALNLGLGAKALSAVNPAGLMKSKKAIINNVLDTHDALENKASEGFQTVSDEVNKRGITQVPIDSGMIDDISQFFPKTKQANALLSDAKSGDYNALRKIQSQLYTEGKKNLSSDIETDRMRGQERLEKRDEINQAISDHLKNTGNTDLDNTLNTARDDFRKLQQIYYNPNMSNAVIKMVDSDVRKIPTNILKVLQENSIPMQNLRDFHPGLQNDVNRYLLRKNALNQIKYLLPVGAVGAAGFGAAKYFDK